MLIEMNLVALAISITLATLIGIQQMMPSFTFGLASSQYLLPAWRGVAVVSVFIWLAGVIIFIAIKESFLLTTKKVKFLAEIKLSEQLKSILMLGIFLSLGMFLFISEKVPIFAAPYPLLAYGVTILAIGLFNTVLGLMVYASLEFYKKWLNKINWQIPAKVMAGAILFFWMGLLLPVVVKRVGIRAKTNDKKNVVVITSDALRGDRFNTEYMPETYSWFENKGVIFENAYVPAPWTVASFTSMMSGKYPSQLGADRGVTWIRENLILLPELELIAERFQDEDYYTAAVLTNTWLTEERGFDQGFDYFENIEKPDLYHWGMTVKDSGWFKVLEQLGVDKKVRLVYEYFVGATSEENDFKANADMVSRAAISKIKELPEPFFIWIHYVDPHDPYEPPVELGPDISQLSEEKRQDIVSGNLNENEKDLIEIMIGLYDGEVRYHDKEIVKILNFLDRRGLSKRTTVVFSSDHGEELNEVGEIGHGLSLREEEVNIPLAIYPRVTEESLINDEVNLWNIGDLLLELGDGKIDEWLSSQNEGEVFLESLSYGSERKAIVSNGKKLVRFMEEGRYELKDLRGDESIALPYSALARELQVKLDNWIEGNLEEREEYSKKMERQDLMLEGAAGY